MSSTPEQYRVRHKPSSSTTTALLLTYRPIIFLLFAGPSIVMSLPFISWMFRIAFGSTTEQHALLTVCMTALFSKIIENSITNAAPTKEIGIKSIERSRGWLLFFSLIGSVVVIRLIVIPLKAMLGLTYILKWSPSISIWSAFRLACGGFLLGLSIVGRYVGPQSIVRCSSSPLMINSYTRAFRRIFLGTRSSLRSPQTLSQPDATPETHVSASQDLNPRRLQLPTPASLSAQIAISILIGFIFAFTSVLPFTHHSSMSNISSPSKMPIIISCIASVTLQLLLTTIHGTNHEISPTKYRLRWSESRDDFVKFINSAVPICFVVTSFGMYGQFENDSFQWSDNLAFFIFVPPAILLYLYTFDYTLRILICTAPSNMKKFVEEASGGDGAIELFVDVVLRVCCHSNKVLVEKLGNLLTNSSIWLDVEKAELKLNNEAIEVMANTLLYKTNEDEASPHLEDDILRLAILSCIGSSPSKEEGVIGNYDDSNICQWMKTMPTKKKTGTDSNDAFAVPIIRALCAYAGGLGEALRLVADSKDTDINDTWVLPPGALFMAECAIRGATHWILHDINSPRSVTSLAILIPVLLNSAYKLEDGILRHQQAATGPTAFDETYMVKVTMPQLLPLFNVCNDCAKIILQTAKANEGFRRVDFLESLDVDCQKWLKSSVVLGNR